MQLCLAPSVGKTAFSAPSAAAGASPLRSISCRCHHDDSASFSAVPNRTPNQSFSLPSRFCQLKENPQWSFAALLLPVTAACTILTACPASVEAGILSGSTGLESFELPSLPTPDVLKKIQAANVEKYKAFDSNFKKSPFLQELLRKSKEKKELHRKEIEDKYCERGAEWGVGDCSLVGLPQAAKDAFYENLRKGK